MWLEEPVRNTHFVSSHSSRISLIAMLPAGIASSLGLMIMKINFPPVEMATLTT